MPARHVVVLGPMAVGKTTVARALAARRGWPWRDSDADLTAARGITGRQLAEAEGIDALHRWEAHELLAALADPTPSVVAAAASVVDDPGCRAALVGGGADVVVVVLTAPPAVLARRMAADRHDAEGGWRRDLGPDETAAIAALDRRREPEFRAVADAVVDTDGRTPAEVVSAVEDALSRSAGRAP